MLHAKWYYVMNILSKKLDDASMKLDDASMLFMLNVRPAVTWLHDSFNFIHIYAYDGDTRDGVRFHLNPSKYKMNKAINILRKYGRKQAINGANGQIDEKVSAIFYYAALLLHSTNEHYFSSRQREIIKKVLVTAERGMEADHRYRMKSNAGILDSLVDTLANANAERRTLKAGWKNHLANAFEEDI